MLLSEDLIFLNNTIGIIEESPFSSDDDDEEQQDLAWQDVSEENDISTIPIHPKSKSHPYTIQWLSNPAFPSTHHSEEDVKLLDHAICFADIVNYKDQLATVLDVDCFYDVLNHQVWTDIDNHSDYVLKNIPNSALFRDHEYLLNETIFYSQHMGIVEDVELDCILFIKETNNNNVCFAKCHDVHCTPIPFNSSKSLSFSTVLTTHHKNTINVQFKHGYSELQVGCFVEMPSFEKLTFLATPTSQSTIPQPTWLSTNISNVTCLIIGLQPHTVTVNWLLKNPFDTDTLNDPPFPPTELIIKEHPNLFPLIPLRLRKNYLPGSHVISNDGSATYQVINTRSYLTLQLQDGTIEKGIPSIAIQPTLFINEEDYLPGDFVQNKEDDATLGIILHVNQKERIATVKWYEEGIHYGALTTPLDQISIFDLKEAENGLELGQGCFIQSESATHPLNWYGEIANINGNTGLLGIKVRNGLVVQLHGNEVLPCVLEAEELEETSGSWETTSTSSHVNEQQPLSAVSSTILNSSDLYLDARDSNERVEMMDSVPLDHYYKAHPINHTILNTFHKEWQLLKDHLPFGILVKGFEERLDLLRVMITGAVSTPYEDALVFFDVYLHQNYPKEPPMVFYKSYTDGKQLNPNLFDNGKVCISLLNTTMGESFEMWHSKSSHLLQLFISIQSLILTTDPFWNEPMHWKLQATKEGDRSRALYFERTVVGSVASIINVMKRPVLGFEKEIKRHFYEMGAKQRTMARLQGLLDQEGMPMGYQQSLEKLLNAMGKLEP